MSKERRRYGQSLVSSAQQQAAASWIHCLNQIRVQELLDNLARQDAGFEEALKELEMLKQSVQELIGSDRGGVRGIHGFIAERMQVYCGNARSLVEGGDREYCLLDDNGPIDYIRNGIAFQQKYVLRNLSLDAVAEHLKKYPDFLKNGGKYQIPGDHYEKIKELLALSEEEGNRLRREEYRLWKYVRSFFEEKDLKFQDIEPALNRYDQVLPDRAGSTIAGEENNIRNRDRERRNRFYQESRPSGKEAGKAAAVSAAAEGGAALCTALYRKRKTGKRIQDFDLNDWKDVGIDTAGGTAKGCIRGAAVYGMTNFTATPAAAASALVTAAFGMAAESVRWKRGGIGQEEFCLRSEILCMDVTVSAFSSVLGEMLIPVPVLGSVLGNTAGMLMYNIAKEHLSEKEQTLILRFHRDRKVQNSLLEKNDLLLRERLQWELKHFFALAETAFSEDPEAAFQGSVRLADCLTGSYSPFPSDRILRNSGDMDGYFLE